MNKIQESSFVYVLQAEGTNRFKIGYSSNPEQRCQVINLQSPFPIKLICSYPSNNAFRDEQKLHKIFVNRRVHGEWFIFESIEHIKGLIDEFYEIKSMALDVEDYILDESEKNKTILKRPVKIKPSTNIKYYPLEYFADMWENVVNQLPLEERPSEKTYAVYCFICEIFNGLPVSSRDCYRKTSIMRKYGLNPKMVEEIFDELQSIGLGTKTVEQISHNRSVRFMPKTS